MPPISKIPEGPEWTCENKLDGYRLETVRSAGKTELYFSPAERLEPGFQYIAADPGDALAHRFDVRASPLLPVSGND